MIVAAIIFWLCLAAMAHTYVTYPLSLRLFRRRYTVPPVMPDDAWPRVAVLIPAYNEEKVIGAKIENSLALDYDPDKIEILIGSDGSTDRTDEIVRGFSDPRVKLIRLPGRSGKPGVLNALVQQTSADILVMTDANVEIRGETFRNLIRHFRDPKVAAVIARKEIRAVESVQAERLYAQHAMDLKHLEAGVGGFSGAYGSYYAIRRSSFRELPMVAMDDDIVALYPAIMNGGRVASEPSAVGFEDAGGSPEIEFKRRIRIGASNFNTLRLCRNLLRLSRGMTAYTFFSHKVLRWCFPFLMFICLAANLLLAGLPFYRFLLIAQILFYGGAAAGALGYRAGLRIPLFYSIFYFVSMNVALFIGWFAYRFHTRTAAWERTAREDKS